MRGCAMTATAKKSALLDSVLDLQAKGFSVIPLWSKGKAPALKGWEAYQSHKASLDEITHWFGNGLDRNVGIVTGAVSGVVVLDVDSDDALAALGDLPKTPTVKTGKGYHFYFKHPGTDVQTRIRMLDSVDLKGDGGYVVAPPSLHSNGTAYAWLVGLDTPLADLPNWVLTPANDNERTSKYGVAWFEDAEALANVKSGQRNDILNQVACKAGSLIASDNLSEHEARAAMLGACKQNGLIADDGLRSVQATINSGITEGKKHPRYPLDPLKTEAVYKPGKGLVIVNASEIKPEQVNWLWPGVLVNDFVLLAGDAGLGKSQVACSVSAIVSTGGKWPASTENARRGSVLIFSMEDSPEHTIVPRLTAAGADLSRVHVVKMAVDDKGQRPVSLKGDMPEIRAAIEQIGDVSLITIDPVTAYLGDANNNDTGDVRAITTELAALAHDYGLCVLGVSHLNKKQDQSAITRVQGSGAWVQAARAAFLVERDADDPDKRSMTPFKNNLAPDSTGFAFTMQSVTLPATGVETSKIVWEGYTMKMTAAQALAARNEGGKLAEAKEFLRVTLGNGPVLQEAIKTDTQQLELSWSTVRLAKDALGVTAEKEKKPNGKWFWKLTSQCIHDDSTPDIDFG